MKKRRVTSHSHGLFAEWLAMFWLVINGYRIRAWRYRSYAGEIDIVAQKRRIIAFVEVKARPSRMSGMEAISAASQRRITSAAGDYIQKMPNQAKFSFRFDLMIVVPKNWPVHIQNAW